MIDDEDLRKEIENFYVLIELANDLIRFSYRRSNEIVQARGSEFYKVKVRDIIYNITTTDGGSSPSTATSNCILFKTHPKDVNYFKTGKPVIQVDYQEGNQGHQLRLDKSEDVARFDELWNLMIEDVNHDRQLQQLETMKLQIHTMNLEIREKLVKKISERHNL